MKNANAANDIKQIVQYCKNAVSEIDFGNMRTKNSKLIFTGLKMELDATSTMTTGLDLLLGSRVFWDEQPNDVK